MDQALNTLSKHVSHLPLTERKTNTNAPLFIFLSLAFSYLIPMMVLLFLSFCLKVSYIKAIDYLEPSGHQSQQCKYLMRKPSEISLRDRLFCLLLMSKSTISSTYVLFYIDYFPLPLKDVAFLMF